MIEKVWKRGKLLLASIVSEVLGVPTFYKKKYIQIYSRVY